MSIATENPVNATVAARELGQGRTRISALKRAMGIKGRYVFLSEMRRFMHENPDFTVDQIYRRKSSQGR
jgi:hypothetical protein